MKTLEIFSVYDQDVETGPTDIAPCGSSSNEGQELRGRSQITLAREGGRGSAKC